MPIHCEVLLQWDSTPAQRRALGAVLWRWCGRATGKAGMYQYLDNQALADLIAGRLPAPGVSAWQAGLPRVQFLVPGNSAEEHASMLESLRQLRPDQGVAEVRVEGETLTPATSSVSEKRSGERT